MSSKKVRSISETDMDYAMNRPLKKRKLSSVRKVVCCSELKMVVSHSFASMEPHSIRGNNYTTNNNPNDAENNNRPLFIPKEIHQIIANYLTCHDVCRQACISVHLIKNLYRVLS